LEEEDQEQNLVSEIEEELCQLKGVGIVKDQFQGNEELMFGLEDVRGSHTSNLPSC
jgi:hypothetical protein